MSKTALPIRDRILRAIRVEENGCWKWQLRLDPHGYGRIGVTRPTGVYGGALAYREAFVAWKGEVPEGLQLDHLCRVRDCVNPDHLEPVTAAENVRRSVRARVDRSHCRHGHAYDAITIYVPPNHPNQRRCRACATNHVRTYQARKQGVSR